MMMMMKKKKREREAAKITYPLFTYIEALFFPISIFSSVARCNKNIYAN
jgi:hypothetical protein